MKLKLMLFVAAVAAATFAGCSTYEAVTGKPPPLTDRPAIAEAIQKDIADLEPVADLIPGAPQVLGIAGLAASLIFGYRKNQSARDNYAALATLIKAIESKGDGILKEKVLQGSLADGTNRTIATAVKAVT